MTDSQTVLITGAAKRIGRELALSMARDGWDVVIHYHSSQQEAKATVQEIEALGRKAACVQGDLRQPEQAARILDAAVEKLGQPIDCLIHNASCFGRDQLENMTVEQCQTHLNLHVTSPLFLSQAFAAQGVADAEGAGRQILFLLDGMEGWSLSPTFFSYSVSKMSAAASIPMLAKSLSPNIRVNGVALGATLEGVQDQPKTFDKIRSITPLARTSNVGEVCEAVRYLTQAKGVTGQILNLSGGMQL